MLTEIFWPAVDVAQTRDHQLLVTDGKTFFFEERKDSVTDVQWTQTGIPAFHVHNRDPKGRFEIEKWVFSDSDRDAVFQHYKIHRQQAGLKFTFHHNPSVENTPLGDSALASLGEGPGAGLYASAGDQATGGCLFDRPEASVGGVRAERKRWVSSDKPALQIRQLLQTCHRR